MACGSRRGFGLGAGALALAMLALGLRLVVPESQSLLAATRDLEPGTVVQTDDVSSVDVRVPDEHVLLPPVAPWERLADGGDASRPVY